MNKAVYWFVKLTGWLPFHFITRVKYHYEDETCATRRPHKWGIIVSNHRSVWDFATNMYTFFCRSPRCVVAEVMYRKNRFLSWVLRSLGCIRVDRDDHDFVFVSKACEVLKAQGMVEIFPEARIPLPGESLPLPFKQSLAWIAVKSGAPIIPVVNDGNYFTPQKLNVMVGKPIDPKTYCDASLSERENAQRLTEEIRSRMIALQDELERRKKSSPAKRQSHLFYDFVRFTGVLPALLWLRPKIRHFGICKLRRLRGVLIYANHRSFIDPVAVMLAMWFRRVRFLAATELFDKPLKKFFFTNVHCIPVDRGNFGMDSFHAVTDCLSSGSAVGIFPEGKITETDEYSAKAVKTGAIMMAHRAQVPILPVYIHRGDKWYQRCRIAVGDPLNIRDICGDTLGVRSLTHVNELMAEKMQELKKKLDVNGQA